MELTPLGKGPRLKSASSLSLYGSEACSLYVSVRCVTCTTHRGRAAGEPQQPQVACGPLRPSLHHDDLCRHPARCPPLPPGAVLYYALLGCIAATSRALPSKQHSLKRYPPDCQDPNLMKRCPLSAPSVAFSLCVPPGGRWGRALTRTQRGTVGRISSVANLQYAPDPMLMCTD